MLQYINRWTNVMWREDYGPHNYIIVQRLRRTLLIQNFTYISSQHSHILLLTIKNYMIHTHLLDLPAILDMYYAVKPDWASLKKMVHCTCCTHIVASNPFLKQWRGKITAKLWAAPNTSEDKLLFLKTDLLAPLMRTVKHHKYTQDIFHCFNENQLTFSMLSWEAQCSSKEEDR